MPTVAPRRSNSWTAAVNDLPRSPGLTSCGSGMANAAAAYKGIGKRSAYVSENLKLICILALLPLPHILRRHRDTR